MTLNYLSQQEMAMNNIQVYLFEILCLGSYLPGEKGAGESSVFWSLTGLSLGLLKHNRAQ